MNFGEWVCENNRDGNTNFGKWVLMELRKMQKTQEWLIKRTGVSSGSIQRWQRGEQPGLDYYLIICSSIARYRGLPVKDVLYQAVREHPILKKGNQK
jgi:DNA-binding XRE family transcriptional regulator